MNPSIRRRLIIYLFFPIAFLRVCDIAYDYYTHGIDARLQINKKLIDTVSALATTTEITPNINMQAQISQALLGDDMSYAIRDSQGVLLAGNATLPILSSNTKNPVYGEMLINQVRLPMVTYHLEKTGTTISVAHDISHHPKTNLPLWRNALWNFFELDISLLLLWIGIHFGLKPLETLRDEVDNRSAHDIHLINETGRPREVLPLLRSLNRLLDLVRQVLSAQRQFISNAAHQLRTPIAGLAAQLELLDVNHLPAVDKPLLARLNSSVWNLRNTANQLLALARAESPIDITTNDVNVELDGITTAVVERFIDRAIHVKIELIVEAEPATVTADPSLLEEMLGNLVDNALIYTPKGGKVTIRSGLNQHMPFLEVEDTGPGIPVAERQNVSQRFYRMPGSPGHGTGLGLAIVYEITRRYGAMLTIDSGENNKGARIRVQWPVQ